MTNFIHIYIVYFSESVNTIIFSIQIFHLYIVCFSESVNTIIFYIQIFNPYIVYFSESVNTIIFSIQIFHPFIVYFSESVNNFYFLFKYFIHILFIFQNLLHYYIFYSNISSMKIELKWKLKIDDWRQKKDGRWLKHNITEPMTRREKFGTMKWFIVSLLVIYSSQAQRKTVL